VRHYSSAALLVLADCEFWANHVPTPDDTSAVDGTAMPADDLARLFG
jgi:hypothetical protein